MIQLWTIDPIGGMPPTSSVLGRLSTPIKTLAFRPPLGRELAAGAGDGSVHVWNVETKVEVLRFPTSGSRSLTSPSVPTARCSRRPTRATFSLTFTGQHRSPSTTGRLAASASRSLFPKP